ncbi:MAG: RNA polymerase sigma factor, partial [bacterium]
MTTDERRNQDFLALLEPLYQRAHTFALHLTGSTHDAEDLMQEAVLQALRKIATLRETARFKSWFYRILHNTWLEQGRRKQRRPSVSMDPEGFLQVADTAAGPADRYSEIEYLLEHVNPIQRETLVLFEVEGMSLKEIADLHGVGIATVKSRLFQAKEKIRRGLHGVRPVPLMTETAPEG